MDGKQPPAPQPSPAEGSAPAQEERCGPVLVRRLVKDDGRALIVYRRPGDDA